MPVTILEDVKTHLEFLGYDVEDDGKVVTAKHAQKLNMIFKSFNGGLLFTAVFTSNDYAKQDMEGFLKFINGLNQTACVARIYADKDVDLLFEGWYPDTYDKAQFGLFMELWDRDTRGQLREVSSEAERFLG